MHSLYAFLPAPVFPPWARVLPGDAALVPVPEPRDCGNTIHIMLTCVMAYNPLASVPWRKCALQPLSGVQADLQSPILRAPALMAELPFSLIDIPINICRFLFLAEATAGWTS